MEVNLGTHDSTGASAPRPQPHKNGDGGANEEADVAKHLIGEQEVALLEQWCGDIIAAILCENNLN